MREWHIRIEPEIVSFDPPSLDLPFTDAPDRWSVLLIVDGQSEIKLQITPKLDSTISQQPCCIPGCIPILELMTEGSCTRLGMNFSLAPPGEYTFAPYTEVPLKSGGHGEPMTGKLTVTKPGGSQ